MDTSETEGPATSTLKRKRSTSGDSSDVIPAKRLRFIAPNRRYDFGFPDSFIYYIAKNPTSAKLYKKLIKVCKYFYWKNPILVANRLAFFKNEWMTDLFVHRRSIILTNIPCKLWITDEFVARNNTRINENRVSSFLPRIYRCEIRFLTLENQKLTTDEFLFLAAKTGRVDFSDLTVVNRDGKEIAFEKLIELIPEVHCLNYEFKDNDKSVTAKSVKELLKLPRLQIFDGFRLYNVPEAFDVETFFAYIKNSKGMFQLEFTAALSVDYQNRLEAIIDELIETQSFDYIPPFISYPGMDDEKYHKLFEVCEENGFDL